MYDDVDMLSFDVRELDVVGHTIVALLYWKMERNNGLDRGTHGKLSVTSPGEYMNIHSYFVAILGRVYLD